MRPGPSLLIRVVDELAAGTIGAEADGVEDAAQLGWRLRERSSGRPLANWHVAIAADQGACSSGVGGVISVKSDCNLPF